MGWNSRYILLLFYPLQKIKYCDAKKSKMNVTANDLLVYVESIAWFFNLVKFYLDTVRIGLVPLVILRKDGETDLGEVHIYFSLDFLLPI